MNTKFIELVVKTAQSWSWANCATDHRGHTVRFCNSYTNATLFFIHSNINITNAWDTYRTIQTNHLFGWYTVLGSKPIQITIQNRIIVFIWQFQQRTTTHGNGHSIDAFRFTNIGGWVSGMENLQYCWFFDRFSTGIACLTNTKLFWCS